jgi:hypothetical protein
LKRSAHDVVDADLPNDRAALAHTDQESLGDFRVRAEHKPFERAVVDGRAIPGEAGLPRLKPVGACLAKFQELCFVAPHRMSKHDAPPYRDRVANSLIVTR